MNLLTALEHELGAVDGGLTVVNSQLKAVNGDPSAKYMLKRREALPQSNCLPVLRAPAWSCAMDNIRQHARVPRPPNVHLEAEVDMQSAKIKRARLLVLEAEVHHGPYVVRQFIQLLLLLLLLLLLSLV